MASRRRAAAGNASDGAKGKRKGKGKGAKAKKKKAPKVQKERVIKPGPPVEVVLCVVTGLMLIVAVVLVDLAVGQQFGLGTLFAGEYLG
jgi:hypothetical protein